MQDGSIRVLDIVRDFHSEWDLRFLEDREEGAKDTSVDEDDLSAIKAFNNPPTLTEHDSIPPNKVYDMHKPANASTEVHSPFKTSARFKISHSLAKMIPPLGISSLLQEF